MSWSVAAIGKVDAVRVEIAGQFARGSKCADPEEAVRLSAAALIDQALAAQDPTNAVKVIANGSQSFKDYTKKTGMGNSLNITVEPQPSFVS